MIAPETLVEQVRHAAPFLFEGEAPPVPASLQVAAEAPRGWHQVLRHAERIASDPAPEAFFLLCLACHHASVGSFVPTDVDSNIRGHLWAPREQADAGWLTRQTELALAARRWDVRGIAARVVFLAGEAPLGGNDGEHLSVLTGALATLARAERDDLAEPVEAALADELAREARLFLRVAREPGAELDALRLAAILAHNSGDVDQAISYWPKHARLAGPRARFSDLEHRPEAFEGAFVLAARVYGALLASEGHRHYPLRAVRALRRSADLLLPLGPFFDDWGRRVGRHPALDESERAEVVAALLTGCRKLAGQQGYQRALAGLDEVLPRGLEGVTRALPNAARATLRDPDLRRALAVPQASFESSYRKRAAQWLRAARA
jgi:hypothetical protein